MTTNVEISKRLVLINTLSAGAHKVLSISVLFWVTQYLVKRVSTDEYAIYAVLLTLMIFVPLLTGVLGGGLARFITVAYAKGDEEGVTRVVSTTFPLCVAAAAVIMIVGSALAFNLDQLLTIAAKLSKVDPAAAVRLRVEAQLMLVLLSVNAAVRICFAPFRLGVNIRQRFLWLHVMQLAVEMFRVTVLLTLLHFFGAKVLWVVVASVPATMTEVGLACLKSRRLVPSMRFRREFFTRSLIKPITSLGGWMLLIRLVAMCREMSGMLFLYSTAWSRPPEMAAVNAASFKLGNMVDNQLRQSVLIAMPATQPVLTAMHATGQRERLRRTYLRFSRYLMWVFLFCSIPLIVHREEIYMLYLGAEKFEELHAASTVLGLLMARFLYLAALAPLNSVAMATGDARPLAICVTFIEAVTVATAYYLIAACNMGAIGLAIAMLSVTVVLHPPMLWWLGLKLTGATWSQWFREAVIPGIAPGLVAAPVWFGLWWWQQPQTWLGIMLCGAAGGVVYTLVVVRWLQPGERADVAKLLAKLRR